jgi:hypothetical protein
MSARRPEGADLDEPLKRALADDLPPDAAAGMQERFDRFRAEAMEKERRSPISFLLIRKSAWALISLLMLVSGSLLQGLSPRSPLADRLTTIGTSEMVSKNLAVAQVMSFWARVPQAGGGLLVYEIEWRKARGAAVLIKDPGGRLLVKFEAGAQERSGEPLLVVVAPLLDPSRLRELLSGEWRLVEYSRQDECETGTYSARSPDGRMFLDFTVDMCAYLPVQINASDSSSLVGRATGKTVWQARFNF